MNRSVCTGVAVVLLVLGAAFQPCLAQVPGILNYQGRVVVNGTNFDGTGQFKFALVNGTGATTYWSNGVGAVSVPVAKGLYAVLLGDTTITNMTVSIPAGVFTNADVRLRVAFNDGVSGLQVFSPDQRIAAAGYALMAAGANATGLVGTIPDARLSADLQALAARNGAGLTNLSAAALASGTLDPARIGGGSITSNMLAAGAVGASQIAGGAVTASALAAGAVTANALAAGSVGSAALANGAVSAGHLAGEVAVADLLAITNPVALAYNSWFAISLAGFGSDRFALGECYTASGGVVHLYRTDGTHLATVANPAATWAWDDRFGYSVAGVGSDGFVVGAPADDLMYGDAGVAYLYRGDGALGLTITNADWARSALFGTAVAGLPSGRFVVGAPEDSSYPGGKALGGGGRAYLYETNGSWLLTITNPTPSSGEDGDEFGSAVAAVGTNAFVVGAPRDDQGGTDSGVAHLFRADGTWILTVTNPTPASADHFGCAVAGVGPDRFVVGADLDNQGGTDAGVAHLYRADGAFLMTITNPAPAAEDYFGRRIAQAGADKALIAAEGANAVYLYASDGTRLLTIPSPPCWGFEHAFGYSAAAVSSDTVVIGAKYWGFEDLSIAWLFRLGTALPGLTVTADNLAPSAVMPVHLATGSVTSNALADGSVVRAAIATGAVGPAQIAAQAVTSNALAAGCVGSAAIADGSIADADISPAADLDAGKIGHGTLPDGVLSANVSRLGQSIESGEIADGAISNADISAAAGIAPGKIAGTALTNATAFGGDVSGAYSNLQLAAGAVGNGELATNAVGSANIADGAVGSADIAASAVSAADLASDTGSLARVSGGRMIVNGNRVVLPSLGAIDTSLFTGLALQYYDSGEGAIMSSFNDGYGYLTFYTKPSGGQPLAQRMIIEKSGKVGIGTNSPAELLHVAGTVKAAALTVNGVINVYSNQWMNDKDLYFGDDRYHGAGWYGASKLFGSANVNGPVLYGWDGGALGLARDTGQSIALQWDQNRCVTIASNLTIYGNAYKPGGGPWSTTSDARLKKNVQPLSGALDKVLALQGVRFEYIDPERIHELSGERIGMVAQDVEKVFPDWVDTGGDGYKRVTCRGFEAVTVEALRELRAESERQLGEKDARIAELEQRLAGMQSRMDELQTEKTRNDALERRVTEVEGRLRGLRPGGE
jgi:hypothetical protein